MIIKIKTSIIVIIVYQILNGNSQISAIMHPFTQSQQSSGWEWSTSQHALRWQDRKTPG